MVFFPNCKINIGLNVIRKRSDSYHDLETLFFPICLYDGLEIIKSDKFEFSTSGLPVTTNDDNIVVKAYKILKEDFNLPPVKIHLHKNIPMGAGLGGGSSDAAFTLIGLNSLFNIGLDKDSLINYSLKLGSDCPFFVINKPCYAEGRGEVLTEMDIQLDGLKVVLIKPDCEVSTAQAYSGVKPIVPIVNLKEALLLPFEEWKGKVENRFEESVFLKFPSIKNVKDKLYESGAVYASMSGSGSTVFGIFKDIPENLKPNFTDCFYWETK